MPGYVMQQNQPQGQNTNWGALGAAFGLGAAGGVSADQVAMSYKKTASQAAIGMWTAVGATAVTALAGNAAMTNANAAMTLSNGITAGATYSQTDMVAVKSALQQLSQGGQNQSLTGYLNISSSVQPSGGGAGAPVAQTTTNNNGLILIGLGIVALVALKN